MKHVETQECITIAREREGKNTIPGPRFHFRNKKHLINFLLIRMYAFFLPLCGLLLGSTGHEIGTRTNLGEKEGRKLGGIIFVKQVIATESSCWNCLARDCPLFW